MNLLKNEPKTLLTSGGSIRVVADSKLCCPLAAFRFRRIPNLASLVAVPSDANLTVVLDLAEGGDLYGYMQKEKVLAVLNASCNIM